MGKFSSEVIKICGKKIPFVQVCKHLPLYNFFLKIIPTVQEIWAKIHTPQSGKC